MRFLYEPGIRLVIKSKYIPFSSLSFFEGVNYICILHGFLKLKWCKCIKIGLGLMVCITGTSTSHLTAKTSICTIIPITTFYPAHFNVVSLNIPNAKSKFYR